MADKVYVDEPCRMHAPELLKLPWEFDCEACEGTGRVIVESDA